MAKKRRTTTAKKTSTSSLKFPLEAYSVVAKEKVEVLQETARITKTNRNAYMLRGEDSEGRKVAAIVSKEKAEYWLEQGVAEKDF